jgi:formylmethanofuran dehydrogenase subunit E
VKNQNEPASVQLSQSSDSVRKLLEEKLSTVSKQLDNTTDVDEQSRLLDLISKYVETLEKLKKSGTWCVWRPIFLAEKIKECLSCGVKLQKPREENKIGDEFLCDKCTEQMMESLDDAWKKHSAFLDAALN